MKKYMHTSNNSDEQANLQSTFWTSRVALACVIITAVISIIAGVGWITVRHILTNIPAGHVPMAPSTALSFLTLSLIMLVCSRQSINHRIRYLAQGAALLVAALCALVVFRNAGATNLNIEQMLHLIPKNVGVGIGRMSPITAASLIIAAFAVLALLSINREKFKGIAAVLATALAISGLTIVMAYAYGNPLFYGGPLIPVALLTGIAMLFLGIGLIATAGPACWPLRLMAGDSLDARLRRMFFPLLFIALIVDNITHSRTDSFGSLIFSNALIDSFLAILIFVVVSIVVSKTTSAITISIERADAERKKAAEALRESNELFSQYMRHSPIYTFIKEVTPTESRILQASDNYQQMIGISGRDMIGKTMQELFPAEFGAKMSNDDWAVVANGEALQLDEDFNGRNYTSIKFPIVLGDKTLLAGYTIDITERKRAEEDKRHFYHDTIKSVTQGKLNLVSSEEIKDYLDSAELTTCVASPSDTTIARHKIKEFCTLKEFGDGRLELFETAVGEAMTNAIKYAQEGRIYAGVRDDFIWVAVSDSGPGISTLTLPGATLRRGFSTKVSTGMGYSIMMEASDEIKLCTGPKGTTVILSVKIAVSKLDLSLDDIKDTWKEIPEV
ncbi:MAG: ATP-binding protein [Armatimonadetes bacterium]|nr:ATP-binding protein [Armatimonadota bacterium]